MSSAMSAILFYEDLLFIDYFLSYHHILLIINCFKPFIASVFSRNFNCQMRKPTIRSSSMPMLYTNRNIHNISRTKPLCFLTPFLVISSSSYTNKYLTASLISVMNMPIIAALKCSPSLQSLVNSSFNVIQKCVLCSLYNDISGMFKKLCLLFDFIKVYFSPSISSSVQTSLAIRKAAQAFGHPA